MRGLIKKYKSIDYKGQYMKLVNINTSEFAKEINAYYRIFNREPYIIMSRKTNEFLEKHSKEIDKDKFVIEFDPTGGKTLFDDNLEFGEVLVR